MEHPTSAYTAGRSAPANDEARSTPHAAGPLNQKTLCVNSRQNRGALQAIADDFSTFARLARQFERIGLRLYPLSGASVLVSAPRLGISRALPNLRAAKVYLGQIGGAA
ncbi:hypothetical protein [Rhodoferax sediminis]|uniref:Uncharacterized protein n=1 Tax=Rhodoferax sediminis TaxID=2509614 RepID=A0A515DFY7_9BURK|nr:hypothetical protein [Rhodoferax sediminis]QDL39335.1 hypothetical protein EUB48_19940 [Rhodoferax sediminis]